MLNQGFIDPIGQPGNISIRNPARSGSGQPWSNECRGQGYCCRFVSKEFAAQYINQQYDWTYLMMQMNRLWKDQMVFADCHTLNLHGK